VKRRPGIDLAAAPRHPYALVLATRLAHAAGNVRGIGAVLEILPAGRRQRSIEGCQLFIVGLGQSPDLVLRSGQDHGALS
jgi:hypothetical protein